jgi:ribonuclease J
VDVYGAFVMHLVAGQARIPRLPAEAGIRVLYNRHFEQTWERRNLQKVHDLFLNDRIELREIQAEPTECVMMFRPSMGRLDFNGVLPPARLLYSYWAGYLVKPDWVTTREQIRVASGEMIECHTSGHIYADDIVTFTRRIAPRQIFPIHTAFPADFRKVCESVTLLEDGDPFTV